MKTSFRVIAFLVVCSSLCLSAAEPPTKMAKTAQGSGYEWTPDHMHVGVRWQPFHGRTLINSEDGKRPVIAEDSSYVQFWTSWSAMEPHIKNMDYIKHPSGGLQTIEQAVNDCNAMGKKVEFVFFHCPAWATTNITAGGFRPNDGLFDKFTERMARHFKGRVHAWQLSHEANLQGLMEGADMDFMMNEIMLKGAKAIKKVYDEQPREPVILSTSGCSPCIGCPTREGLESKGGEGVSQFYDQLIANKPLMQVVDALNMNVSDQNDGYGKMDRKYVPSVWGNYDLARKKLDDAGYRSKKILSAESWISWDNGVAANDVNWDLKKNEKDAYIKAIAIIGNCLERGLNTINMPWSDNSSGWAMGLTKRRDHGGLIKKVRPEIVIPASDGGADVVTEKIGIHGPEKNITIVPGGGDIFTIDNYINPPDPNHLHYYIWRWYAQIAGGSDEVIRHALADEKGNDILVKGDGYKGKDRYRISSYNRTKQQFTVLVYAEKANGSKPATVSIPSTIRTGVYYNNDYSRHDFRGEGFVNGQKYYAHVRTKDISIENGEDVGLVDIHTADAVVEDGMLTAEIPAMNKFTTIRFIRRVK